MSWIDDQFPDAIGRHRITSEVAGEYNCIAYAAEDQTEWWSHRAGYRWPSPNRSPLIESLESVFLGLGYEKRPPSDTALEEDYDKVALYARHGLWQHAARQQPDGKWTSKLGPDEDIEHDNPTCICGDSYGQVHCIMRKSRNEQATPKEGGEHASG